MDRISTRRRSRAGRSSARSVANAAARKNAAASSLAPSPAHVVNVRWRSSPIAGRDGEAQRREASTVRPAPSRASDSRAVLSARPTSSAAVRPTAIAPAVAMATCVGSRPDRVPSPGTDRERQREGQRDQCRAHRERLGRGERAVPGAAVVGPRRGAQAEASGPCCNTWKPALRIYTLAPSDPEVWMASVEGQLREGSRTSSDRG